MDTTQQTPKTKVTVFGVRGNNFNVDPRDYDCYVDENGNLQFRWTRNLNLVRGDEVWVKVGEDKYIFTEGE